MSALQFSAATLSGLINGNQGDSSGKATNGAGKKSGGDQFSSLLDVVGNADETSSARSNSSKKDEMKIGAGLTIMNGLSRFSQPSVGTIMSMDVPVFLQYSVDQIDQFDRRLAIYARGQLSKLDYRIYMANPFPISSNGTTPPAIGMAATFVNPLATYNGKGTGIHNQFGGYLAWNFFENEPHTTPYMAGTYLGNKKIVNIASGIVFQKNATWRLSNVANSVALDTVYDNMLHLSFETFIDLPLNYSQCTILKY